MTRWLLVLFALCPTLVLGQSTLDGLRSIQPPPQRFQAVEEPREDADGQVEVSVQFKLCIDATGRITCLEPTPDQPATLVNAMIERIPSWRFKAADRDGKPVSAESTLRVTLKGQRVAGGGFEMKVVDTSLGPRYAKVLRPKFPDRALGARRGGGVMVAATVMPDGALRDLVAKEDLSDRIFVGAALQALRHWQLVPERVEGKPVATRVLIPIVFSFRGEPRPVLRWEQSGSITDDSPRSLDSAITLVARDP